MGKLVELIQSGNWDEAYEAFSEILEEGNLDEEACVCGATIMEHFGSFDAMYDAICYGLKLNPRNYELYLLLGNYYSQINPDQAYLSYENALYFAKKQGADEDAETIQEIIDGFVQDNPLSVRNVSFVVLSYNTLDYTKLCVQSIRDTCKKGCYEIVVVDNGSVDGSAEWLREQDDIVLALNEENVGFPAGCNQGVRMAAPDNDIFLLNNDTLMMNNSLYLLRMGLYESEKNGTAGAVTNCAKKEQVAYDKGEKIEDYYTFAYNNNVPRANAYEQKSMLVMFAMMIKRRVFDVVGGLDERFTPGNYEDDDYGLRVLEAGFRNVLCWNSYIYHYGSKSFRKDDDEYVALIDRNRAKFIEKWGFAPRYYMFTRREIANMIDADADAAIRVLEVGCGLGNTLSYIKYKFPNAEVHGIELAQRIAELGSTKLDIKCGNIETTEFSPDDKYDYIIFANVLERLYDPYTIIRRMKNQLNENGCILTSIHNVMNAGVIYELLNGNFTYKDAGILDRTHIRFFTWNEIQKMFENEGYVIDHYDAFSDPNEMTTAHEEFFDKLLEIVGREKKVLFDAYQFVVRARVKK